MATAWAAVDARTVFEKALVMESAGSLVDIHGHYVPDIDDGARTWQESLQMARIAAAEGIDRLIVTPHQLGNYAHNSGAVIRTKVAQFQQLLTQHKIPVKVRPGADVRIEPELVDKVRQGSVLTLADRGRHILLELPHEIYLPMDNVIAQLLRMGIVPVLSHPERNQGIIRQPQLVKTMVAQGCLMQVTASSLLGAFGEESQRTAEQLLRQRLVHFLATDAHGAESRRPLMKRAFECVAKLTDFQYACQICRENPLAVFEGRSVSLTRSPANAPGLRWPWTWWRRAA